VPFVISQRVIINLNNKKNRHKNGSHVKLFSDFYKSDIIIASPLGLKLTIFDQNPNENDNDNNNVDLLSIIEICLVDHCDVLLMENWDHVDTALESLNRQPRRFNNHTDFSLVSGIIY